MKRLFVLFCVSSTFLLVSAVYAAEPTGEIKFSSRAEFREIYAKLNDAETDPEKGVTGYHVKLTVSGAELPYPLLKYRFNTYVTETEAGNAAPIYADAVAELREVQKWREREVYESEEYVKAKLADGFGVEWKDGGGEAAKKLLFAKFPFNASTRIKDFGTVSAESEAAMFGSLRKVYELVERAGKKRYCDWSYQVDYIGIATQLPHVQNMRVLNIYLQQKAQWEIRNGNYDDAVKTIRQGLRLAEHIENSDMPWGVTSLVANAIRTINLRNIQLLSNQPDAPNLYPALTQIAGSRNLMQKTIQTENYGWMSSGNFTPQQTQALFERLDENNKEDCKTFLDNITNTYLQGTGQMYDGIARQVSEADTKNAVAAACIFLYPYGEERLLKRGWEKSAIEKLSVYQVVAPYVGEKIRGAYDEFLVAERLPADFKYIPKEAGKPRIDFKSRDENTTDDPTDIYLSVFLASVGYMRVAFLRVEQEVDLLQITEAIRFHAALHNGKIPDSLDQLELHVNKTSATESKPFNYRTKNNTAIIDYRVGTSQVYRLEITVEKDKK
ncbi:MAG: hypothetical protein LBK06_01000 [Planctomycetaceae bacterium]|jgi:hypothetical protein|nr:hypothetical protein [Planctomycetaceae bacterium]